MENYFRYLIVSWIDPALVPMSKASCCSFFLAVHLMSGVYYVGAVEGLFFILDVPEFTTVRGGFRGVHEGTNTPFVRSWIRP